ncbi:glycosyltransferase family 2 protein [Nesterenkonia natronophila]|uniref:Glycosyltransferase n=1 Tax=Nesterenkonia natronophila TaxID=2174932 RepID=A0A3A4F188_9MICC|nr:glycosyltransferase [Nesterenkonia natronophila]RJN31606.1 glycosyltransferase [Nesterenkonia natronophila]
MSASEPLVSIVIPVFDGKQHLAECLDSVRHQSYWKLEIVVVNDGSTDGTERILSEAEQQDDRIVAIHRFNGGVSTARNAGLDAATGQWVMFVDADDIMHDRLLVETIVRAGEPNVDLIWFEATSDKLPSTGGNQALGRAEGPESLASRAQDFALDGASLAELIASESLNALWDKAYRREAIVRRHCRFREGIRMGEDLLFNLAYARLDARVRSIPITGYFYRRTNTESATRRYLPQKYTDLMAVSDDVCAWAHRLGVNEVRGAAEYIRAKNVISCIRDLHHEDCELSYQERLATAQCYKSRVPTVRAHGIGTKRRLLGEVYNFLGFRTVFHLTRLLLQYR